MESGDRSKRALIAYCALAERLTTPGIGMMQALTPFLAEACRQFSGDLFDAAKFSDAVAQRYGIRIPRLAALGLAEQLSNEGLLTTVDGPARSTIYRYTEAPFPIEESSSAPVTETEVELVVGSFVKFCRTDERLNGKDDSALQDAFFDRLLNADSMRILSRREASIAAKKTATTLVLGAASNNVEPVDRDELHIDFLVSQFLLDLRDRNAAAFDRVSNVAFANMAAEAIACFREPNSAGTSLENLTVYLDSPLLLDILGVNTEYADYGRELLDAIRASGAQPAAFDHCIAEAESAIHAQLMYLRSGINQTATSWGTTAKPDLLSALIGNVAERAEQRLGIQVERDPEINLHKRFASTVGDIEAEMALRMQAWRKEDAKEHDRKSVWSMLSIRDNTEVCSRICDSRLLLLTRNTALVGIANKAWRMWLKGSTKHSQTHIDRWSPVAMSDKQFAGYLWARTGGGDAAISRARLLAHCSAAVRPRADVKARAYNMVLELSGREEADDVAALLEDREGARALMRATRGDPEDVTKERLPFILERVKLAAGEFAAAVVREESDRELEEARAAHELEVRRLREQAAVERTALEALNRENQAAIRQLHEERNATETRNLALQSALAAQTAAEEERKKGILRDAFLAGIWVYRALRWGLAILFGIASGVIALLSTEMPKLAAVLSVGVGILGFWFVPNMLDRPLTWLAMKRLRAVVTARGANVRIPEARPDFSKGTWVAGEDGDLVTETSTND